MLFLSCYSTLNETKLINEGVIAEQFIGQHLQAMLSDSPNRQLNYWLRQGRSANAEVDYVLGLNGQIIPIEVKAGATGRLKSLHQFVGEKGVPFAVRFDAGQPSEQTLNTIIKQAEKSVEIEYKLVSLPLYLVERLPDLKFCTNN
jgi:hypothetical protein